MRHACLLASDRSHPSKYENTYSRDNAALTEEGTALTGLH